MMQAEPSASRPAVLRAEIARLQQELASLEPSPSRSHHNTTTTTTSSSSQHEVQNDVLEGRPLKRSEYRRYGRQMILDGFGLPAQVKLKSSRVLVIGAGGLGCPLLLYLANAGVGHVTVVDHDSVELSNLHRQVLHTEASVGVPKAVSAQRAIQERNPSVHVEPIVAAFTPSLAASLDVAQFDLALDCSDNPATRYLLNDVCVAHHKTLISGAAIRLDGQLVCWNLPPPLTTPPPPQTAAATGTTPPARGPCYRCVFPEVKEAESQRCEDEGVLGTVTGVIGTLMANEAIRFLTGQHDFQPKLTLFSAFSNPPFRTLRIKGKKDRCPTCSHPSPHPTLLHQHLEAERAGEWTLATCGIRERVPLGSERISVQELAQRLENGGGGGGDGGQQQVRVVDVRSEAEFSIAALPGSQNIPLQKLKKDLNQLGSSTDGKEGDLVLLCRRGNDSLEAARLLREQQQQLRDTEGGGQVKDVAGGLRAWSSIDPDFPIY